MPPRATPFDLVFGHSAPEVFPGLRRALEQAGQDARDRDRFLMIREVVALLRELRPPEGLGEGIDQLAALLHHAYLFWEAEQPIVEVSLDVLVDLLGTRVEGTSVEAPTAYYAAVPEHRIWAEVIPGYPPEPLDGCFVHSDAEGDALRVLGVFGIHQSREGFSVVEAAGRRPTLLARADGSELFAPTLAGGRAAGLFSITGEEELLELGWRTQQLGGWTSELRAKGSDLRVISSPLPAPGS